MNGVLDGLPRIGLAELEERAALQTRVDRKYIVAIGEADWLLETLAPDAVVLEIGGIRQFTYESRYFDTPELSSYHRTAHRHRRRFKVRTRTYVDSGTCWLEVKVPGPRPVAPAGDGDRGDQDRFGRVPRRPAVVAPRPPARRPVEVRHRTGRPPLGSPGGALATSAQAALHRCERGTGPWLGGN